LNIYVKSLNSFPYYFSKVWNKNRLHPLAAARKNAKSKRVFLYDRHDKVVRNIDFAHFISPWHWEQVRNGRASILLNYTDDFFHVEDIRHFCRVLIQQKIPSHKVYMLVMDPLWVDFARKVFDEHGLGDARVTDFPLLALNALKAFPSKINALEPKRFSMLSRNYRPWRLHLYLELLRMNVLDKMDYSFHNIDPYANKTYSHEEIQKDAQTLGFKDNETVEWINRVPYDIGSSGNKWFAGTYDLIANSKIHVLIESHFNPYQTGTIIPLEAHNWTQTEWAPAFATEKFYKALLCQVPFVVVSSPHFLREIRRLGYETFAPGIREDYDDLLDDLDRVRSIAHSIGELANLSDDALSNRLNSARETAARNRNTFMNYMNTPKLTGEFKWLREFFNDSKVPPTWFD